MTLFFILWALSYLFRCFFAYLEGETLIFHQGFDLGASTSYEMGFVSAFFLYLYLPLGLSFVAGYLFSSNLRYRPFAVLLLAGHLLAALNFGLTYLDLPMWGWLIFVTALIAELIIGVRLIRKPGAAKHMVAVKVGRA